MSDSTADQSAESDNRRNLFHFVFMVVFCSLAILASIAWFAAIGWILWQAISYPIGWLLG
jgi:hypothetical protein